MRPSARQDLIVDYVEKRGSVTVEFLASTLSTSRETIRRDLSALAKDGRVRKFHGGASELSAYAEGQIVEGSFQARMHENVPQKRRIAKATAALFKPGDSIFVDTGSTTVYLAEELGKLSGLTVISNSILVAQQVSKGANNRVFLIGGEYRDDTAQNVGRLALDQIGAFKAAHLVITVGAIDADGVSDFNPEEAEIAQAMLGQSRSLTVIADSSKLGKTAIFQVCDLKRIQRMVLDQLPASPLAQTLLAAGIEIIIAD
ncbi:DeoR/GlpR family DNA-binding transcription regulator [Bosea sp. 685]|uniref:DeoR/GlpR family DNA-binding transcription regulator n=1 Tax=Bosea sp. 685 TaxID=3080057 RepID=UPI002892CC08|nr:DeoR/GlpR family DNA-binding transcription regulator [Bosea sp. 685]WNJ91533.1 DeoR/GlpR family DNA-binding transcription regulator [Bosea sp. 685]